MGVLPSREGCLLQSYAGPQHAQQLVSRPVARPAAPLGFWTSGLSPGCGVPRPRSQPCSIAHLLSAPFLVVLV
jgi:hypothetical protein